MFVVTLFTVGANVHVGLGVAPPQITSAQHRTRVSTGVPVAVALTLVKQTASCVGYLALGAAA